ncbi:MAG TPA: VOC family protein [Solirubrobacteraceae bacterium]|jgi:predicted enzyme related to lactoylglutathione lyase|nr:VOC family protein [Solirubrobacteraceae bacterium]
MPNRLAFIEFPADDPDRAVGFWSTLLEIDLEPRTDDQGDGWQASGDGPAVGVHRRGTGPGDTFSLPYFEVKDVEAALSRVKALGGTVVHPGAQWAICKDSEGSPFGLARRGDRGTAEAR